MERILTFDDLRTITGFERAGDVIRCLRRQGVHVFLGKAGVPWTTLDLINHAGGLVVANNESNPYPIDIVRR